MDSNPYVNSYNKDQETKLWVIVCKSQTLGSTLTAWQWPYESLWVADTVFQ